MASLLFPILRVLHKTGGTGLKYDVLDGEMETILERLRLFFSLSHSLFRFDSYHLTHHPL